MFRVASYQDASPNFARIRGPCGLRCCRPGSGSRLHRAKDATDAGEPLSLPTSRAQSVSQRRRPARQESADPAARPSPPRAVDPLKRPPNAEAEEARTSAL